jgi:hypothetical protein
MEVSEERSALGRLVAAGLACESGRCKVRVGHDLRLGPTASDEKGKEDEGHQGKRAR